MAIYFLKEFFTEGFVNLIYLGLTISDSYGGDFLRRMNMQKQ